MRGEETGKREQLTGLGGADVNPLDPKQPVDKIVGPGLK